MRIIPSLVTALLVGAAVPPTAAGARQAERRPAQCETTQECRERGLEAAAEGDYERFHDFAWLAVGKGPRNDPGLMTLLARAQSLSGRPHDALVMLQRLADMGVATDAATSEDFRRVRALPGWAALEARLAALAPEAAPQKSTADVASEAAARAAPSSPSAAAPAPPGLKALTPFVTTRRMRAPAPAVPPIPPAAASSPSTELPPGPPASPAAGSAGGGAATSPAPNLLRFSTLPFQPAGLAYDAVSARFIIGSREERKLSVIGERSGRLANLVGEDSAGFGTIDALALDPREGNLWVASTPDAGAPRLHKLQLISGRLLFTADVPDGQAGGRLADIAVAPDGSVLALDPPNRRLLRLPPGSRVMDVVSTLDVSDPVSVAAAPGGAIYVAAAEGVVRLNAGGRAAGALELPEDVEPARLAWIRVHRGSLVAVERRRAGTFRIVRIRLAANGRTAAGLDVLADDVQLAGVSSVALVGDELFYLGRDPGYTASGGMDFVIRRIALGSR